MACVTFQRQTQKGKMGSGDEEQQPKQGLVSEGGFLCCTWVERPWKNNLKKKNPTHLGYVCFFCRSTGVVFNLGHESGLSYIDLF